jgi:uncharacterized protein (TIGR02145 family)
MVITANFSRVAQSGAESAFTDTRNGKTYKTIKIGGKVWLAENLNYKTNNSWCYDNADSNCVKYGRLYDWKNAKKACPKGWHLPSRQEWDNLCRVIGGNMETGSDHNGYLHFHWLGTGKRLKSTSGWDENRNGTGDYGFSAMPGGCRYYDGSFNRVGKRGGWWTATKDTGWSDSKSNYCYTRTMDYSDDYVFDNGSPESTGYSVRCVQDVAPQKRRSRDK